MTIEALRAAIRGKKLTLTDAGLTALPDDLTPLAAIEHLDLSGNPLAALPEAITQLPLLRTLTLAGCGLTALPDVFDRLPHLTALDLRRNKLRALPQSLTRAPSLTTLRLASNRFDDVPDLLWHTRLTTYDGIKGYANGPARRAFEAFYQAIHQVDRTPAARARAFHLFRGKPDATTPTHELLEALTFPHDDVREAARDALLRRGDHAAAPVGPQSRVAILGTIHGRRTDLKARLATIGAGYATTVDDTTTHVVLGNNPKEWDGADRPGLVYCTETQLVADLDAHDTPYLVEEARHSPDAARDVADMLQSPDRDTVAMALELLKAGGVPPGVITALFYVGKAMGDKTLGNAARALLKIHGSDAMQRAVAARDKLFSTGDKAEKKTAAALTAYARIAPELDLTTLALLIKRDHGVGLRYVLDTNPPGSDARRRALRMMITDGTLDLYTHYAGYLPDHYNEYAHYDPEPLPPELYDFTELTSLDLHGCRISALPHGISALRNLRVLDLRGNFLSALPDDFGDLASLEELHLGNNRFDVFPTAQLTRLTALRRLTFVGNRGPTPRERPALLHVPPELREALPDCAIEDGIDRRQQYLQYHWDDKK
ncbi:MAG: leucine-rich repeat domain-containing protein [bacterium]